MITPERVKYLVVGLLGIIAVLLFLMASCNS